ncbi:MAG: LarC family nickel insertion protein [Methanomicrobiales archaeon]|nr:LarC family nickel insertion protein [Methanomicrobiales archaeon]
MGDISKKKTGYDIGYKKYGNIKGYQTNYSILPFTGDRWRGGIPPVERVVMLETNLDDITGEVLGYTMDRLMEEGALDVFVIPGFGKKNRPVHILSIMSSAQEYSRLAKIMMVETGTLGIRVLDVPKIVAQRSRATSKVRIEGKEFLVQVKTSVLGDTPIAKKPEFEDAKRIASELNLPLSRVLQKAHQQICEER